MNGICSYCNKPNTGRQWCKKCDPEHLVESWNIENNHIRECILNHVKKANHYDDPFLEYIPYENFEIIEKIGEGSYGVVYHAKWKNGLRHCEGGAKGKKGETDVAIKEIRGGYDVTLDFTSMIDTHLQCFYEDRNYVSRRLLKLYGISQNPNTKSYIIVMDYKEGGSLRNYLNNEFQESQWKHRIEVLYNISGGMKRIHRAGCVHGNLHCGNILVNKVGTNTYITGFGFSSTSPDNNMRVLEGVLPYIAPEILRGQSKSKESDVYSFGVIMTEMTTGKPPFCNTTHDEKLAEKICKGLRPEINKTITPAIYFNLAKQCLDADPTRRPNFNELHDTLAFWHDTLSGRGLHPDREGEAVVIRGIFDPLDKIQIESSYTPSEGVFYTRRTLGFGRFSEPENYKDHYNY